MIIYNHTSLDTRKIEAMLLPHVDGWPHDAVRAYIRYSRSAAFSGLCYYDTGRLFINLGRNVRYPYKLPARIARAQTARPVLVPAGPFRDRGGCLPTHAVCLPA